VVLVSGMGFCVSGEEAMQSSFASRLPRKSQGLFVRRER
jgi:hypothetical protein